MALSIVALLAAIQGGAAEAAFKCVDENGRSQFADTPPAACTGTIYEISGAGSIVRKIEHRGVQEKTGDGAEKVVEAQKAAERRRRDTALLDSYSSEREIDAVRDRSVEVLNVRLGAARTQLQRLQTREKDVQVLAAGSPKYAGDLERLKAEVAMEEASASRLERELTAIREQFAADKMRWKELRAKATW